MYIYYMKWIQNNNLQSFLVSVTLKLVCFGGHLKKVKQTQNGEGWYSLTCNITNRLLLLYYNEMDIPVSRTVMYNS